MKAPRVLALALAFALAATASFATAATESAEPEAAVEAVMVTNAAGKVVEKPQYGGELNFPFVIDFAQQNFDPATNWIAGWVTTNYYKALVHLDWAKGPLGTNEVPLNGAARVSENVRRTS